MRCRNCGRETEDGSPLCPACAQAPADPPAEEKPRKKPRKKTARQMMAQGERVGETILLCADGKYRWIYELHLLKNPTIFLLVWKILFFVLLGIFAVFVFPSDLGRLETRPEQLWVDLRALGYFILGMTVVALLGYLLYAAVMKWKYVVLFEMDETGVLHKQVAWQAKRAQTLSELTALAGLASGRLTTVGVGMNAARTEMYSEFSRVRRVKAFPRRELIKVNQRLGHNQVYVKKADFAFVRDYILAHCPEARGTPNNRKP